MLRTSGFTLYELIVTVALAALIVTLGVPVFQDILRVNRLATQTNNFVAALSLARSEALKSGSRVTLCKSADSATCASAGGYEQGWIVFNDPDANLIPNRIIRAQGPLPAGLTLRGPNVNAMNTYLSFTSQGLNRANTGAIQMGTFSLCIPPQSRRIIINATGRARVSQIAAACP